MTAEEPGAPIAKDAVDPDLIKLARNRPKIGAVTAAAIVILCGYFMLRLSADRKFAGEGEPTPATVADVASGKLAAESYIALDGEPLMANAIRASKQPNGLGMRVTPLRGSGDRVWLALTDGDDTPNLGRYTGRLRALDAMPFDDAVRAYAAANPRPVFATPAALQAGAASGKVQTVAGDTVAIAAGDAVAYDIVVANSSAVIVTFTDRSGDHPPLLDAASWQAELGKYGIPATPSAGNETLSRRDAVLHQARFDVAMPIADVAAKLDAAKLWARVEPTVRHEETTWGAVQGKLGELSSVDLVGLYVMRGIPADARILLVGEKPAEYWHVLPITVVLGLIGLLFLWALVRAIRDLLPARA